MKKTILALALTLGLPVPSPATPPPPPVTMGGSWSMAAPEELTVTITSITELHDVTLVAFDNDAHLVLQLPLDLPKDTPLKVRVPVRFEGDAETFSIRLVARESAIVSMPPFHLRRTDEGIQLVSHLEIIESRAKATKEEQTRAREERLRKRFRAMQINGQQLPRLCDAGEGEGDHLAMWNRILTEPEFVADAVPCSTVR